MNRWRREEHPSRIFTADPWPCVVCHAVPAAYVEPGQAVKRVLIANRGADPARLPGRGPGSGRGVLDRRPGRPVPLAGGSRGVHRAAGGGAELPAGRASGDRDGDGYGSGAGAASGCSRRAAPVHVPIHRAPRPRHRMADQCGGPRTRLPPDPGPAPPVVTAAARAAPARRYLRARGPDRDPYYDSMLAKLIVHGDSRAEALDRSAATLDAFEVEGVSTTIGFQRAMIDHRDFIDGRAHTRWIEDRGQGAGA